MREPDQVIKGRTFEMAKEVENNRGENKRAGDRYQVDNQGDH